MDADSATTPGAAADNSDDLHAAVRVARDQLANVIVSLTRVLQSVAQESKPDPSQQTNTAATPINPPNGTTPLTAPPSAATGSDSAISAPDATTLTIVLQKVAALKAAVEKAQHVYDQEHAKAAAADAVLPTANRAALQARRAVLVDQVRAKNERIVILIHYLRELHRDSLAFLSTSTARSGVQSVLNRRT